MPDVVAAVGFSADGTMAVTGSGWLITIWDGKTDKWLYKLRVPRGGISAALFLPDNERIVAAGRGDRHIRIWTIDTDVPEAEIPIDVPKDDGVRAMVLIPGGTLLAAATFGNVIHIVDIKAKRVTDVFHVHAMGNNGYKYSLAMSPNGKYLASAGGLENVTVVLDLHAKNVLFRLKGDPGDVMPHVAWSRDGKILATASSRHVLLWDAVTGDFVSKLDRLPGFVHGLEFSPKDDVLAIIATDSVYFWRSDTKEYARVEQHKGAACLAFSPDGKLLITGSNHRLEQNAKIWKVPGKDRNCTPR